MVHTLTEDLLKLKTPKSNLHHFAGPTHVYVKKTYDYRIKDLKLVTSW